jgi:hypothetical protein
MTLPDAPTAPHLNVLSFRFVLDEGDPDDEGANATLRPVVDGVDLLDGVRLIRGCDPDDLLGTRARHLLPLAGSSDAAVGVCTCGELGCGSFRISVSRRGDVVEWGAAACGQTITGTYRFGLVAYLDALEQAKALRPYEGRGRRVARIVTQRLSSEPDGVEHPLLPGRTQVDWVSAWPWTSDVVRACVVPPGSDQQVLDFPPLPDEDDAAFAERVAQRLEELAWPSPRLGP